MSFTNKKSGSTSTSSNGDNIEKVERKSENASHPDNISSSAESSSESDNEPRRKLQPVQPTTGQPIHQLKSATHLSSYGGVTDGENGNSCKSYPGDYDGSYAET